MNGEDLRARLATGDPVLMPGVWDALSARLARRAGHEVAFLSGYSVSATLLGLPDFGYLTQREMAEVARRGLWRRARPHGDRRRRHRLREPAQHHPHRRALGGGRGHRDVPGGPGLAQEVRPHGRQGGGTEAGLAGQARGRRGPPDEPAHHRPHRCPGRGEPGGGHRAGPDGPGPGGRRRLHRSPRVPGRAGADRRRPARLRAGGQHGRGGKDPTAHAGGAPRPGVRPDRRALWAGSTPRRRP